MNEKTVVLHDGEVFVEIVSVSSNIQTLYSSDYPTVSYEFKIGAWERGKKIRFPFPKDPSGRLTVLYLSDALHNIMKTKDLYTFKRDTFKSDFSLMAMPNHRSFHLIFDFAPFRLLEELSFNRISKGIAFTLHLHCSQLEQAAWELRVLELKSVLEALEREKPKLSTIMYDRIKTDIENRLAQTIEGLENKDKRADIKWEELNTLMYANWDKEVVKKDTREYSYFDIFESIDRPFHNESYFNMCINMDEEEELIGNETFKDLILKKRGIIFMEDKEDLIKMLKSWREDYNTPKTHYWWWIDEL